MIAVSADRFGWGHEAAAAYVEATRSLWRSQAQGLLPRLEAATRRPELSDAARLHLKDSADTLRAALAAPLQRAGV